MMDPPLDLNDPLTTLHVSRALGPITQLLAHFGLTWAEQAALLAVSVRSIQRAARGHDSRLNTEQLTRASLVVAMVQAIGVLYDPATGQGWFRRPNKRRPFGGLPPVEYMQREGLAGMIEARRVLEADRSGGLFKGTPEAVAQVRWTLQPDINLDE